MPPDIDEELPQGNEPPYRPWWLTDEGMARMRALEDELDFLLHPEQEHAND
jgi:hypothetical protein